MPTDTRQSIQSALKALEQLSPSKGQADPATFRESALSLLATLGYQSDKTITLPGSKPSAFLDLIREHSPDVNFDLDKALYADWKTADLLFQLTDDDIAREATLFQETEVKPALLRSYLFFAIELTGDHYARGKLTAVARQINRVFPMPVMVLIKHLADKKQVLSIAVINRRQNKRDAHKDVLGKVTIIRDISLANPHRGHLDILDSFAFPNLVHPEKKKIQDFDTLHAAWEQIFNIELLNNRFYKELANWYFWALPQVEFPADLEPDDEKRRATGLIRLLTRLIFCWFLKEKDGLIPEKLFDPTELATILKDFDPESNSHSTYYLAILQNLFFATLNQRMGKDGKGNPYRFFARDEGFPKNKATHDVNNLYRYESLFAIPEDEALALFADIPFLNGGLFECLDRTDEATNKKLFLDGFTRNKKKRPIVPDHLFFDAGETADLSAAYGDKKRKKEHVCGLISILNRYKFTIVENTPIDQEIALDPELLGKVFENLLASYNEETKTTARKQTGSFYTPRPIVDYMVDESLKAHLKQKLEKVEQTFLSASSNLSAPSNQQFTKTHRNLPHWKKDGAIYWITFRMADSLPQEKLKTWKAERDIWSQNHPEPWDEVTWKEYDERFGDRLDQWLDAGMGSRALARPEIRETVKSCLLRFDGERLVVHSAVIMPNHVHALIEPLDGHDLSKLLQGIKGASARAANQILGTTGTFWLDESYDHIVRSEAQYKHFLRYIADNPIKAGLRENEYWLLKGGADIPVCSSSPTRQTRMSAPLSERLDHLFTYNDQPHQFSEAEVATLITAIDEVKILDPACGSGAFPMGVLHKLVYILSKLDPDNGRWKQTQLAKLDSAPMREELERTFEGNNDDYGRKLYLIENCLYGVDIQPIAIQITKLRFFISLVCDQKTNRDKAKNHGIRPLPNLETKFVAANTLIGIPKKIVEEGHLDLTTDALEHLQKQLQNVRHQYFTVHFRRDKLRLQREDKELRQKLAHELARSYAEKSDAETVEKLAMWDPFDPQACADFFDPHWMFGKALEHGFDLVIGNPPYMQIKKGILSETQFPWSEGKDVGKQNLYKVFLEAACNLLRSDGVACMIVQSSLMADLSSARTREMLLTQTIILKVIEFPKIAPTAKGQVFASVLQGTCICLFRNSVDLTNQFFISSNNDVTTIAALEFERVSQNDLIDFRPNSFEIPLFKCGEFQVYKKLFSKSVPLKKIMASINQGDLNLTTNSNSYSQTVSSIKLFRGRNIHRFSLEEEVSDWVKSNEFERKAQSNAENTILVCQEITGTVDPRRLIFTLVDRPNELFLFGHTVQKIVLENQDLSKFVLAFLNSKLMDWCFRKTSTNNHVGGYELEALPFPSLISPKVKELVATIADRILSTKQANPAADTTALEREIDQQVYALYDLTPEEIAIVEGTVK
jgi:REP element-mobilizing transposase RayT/type I restriction-modification system DNA methylase subunit